MSACVPELGIVNEAAGDKGPIDKLPGNNPVWCAEDGKGTDPKYVETATVISATPPIPEGWSMTGCLARDEKTPDIYAFAELGFRETGIKKEMSPNRCLSKCSDYTVSAPGTMSSHVAINSDPLLLSIPAVCGYRV